MDFINTVCLRIPHYTAILLSDIGYDPRTSGFTIHTNPFMMRCSLSNRLDMEETFYLREIMRRISSVSGIGFRILTPLFNDFTPFLDMRSSQILHLQPDILQYMLIDHAVEVVVVPCVMTEGDATFLEWQVVLARIDRLSPLPLPLPLQ